MLTAQLHQVVSLTVKHINLHQPGQHVRGAAPMCQQQGGALPDQNNSTYTKQLDQCSMAMLHGNAADQAAHAMLCCCCDSTLNTMSHIFLKPKFEVAEAAAWHCCKLFNNVAI